MITRAFLIAVFVVFCSLSEFAQTRTCDETTDFVLDKEKPSVYLTFEKFGKALDWKESKLGQWSDKSNIKKGDDNLASAAQ